MTSSKIIGNRLFLRQLTKREATEDYLGWLNNPEITAYTESRFGGHTIESIREYIDLHDGKSSFLFGIFLKNDDKHIGNIRLTNVGIHKNGHVGIMIGEKSRWGSGYGSEAIKLLNDFAFNDIHLHTMTAYIYSGNIGSIKAFFKSGYEEHGTRKEVYSIDGGYMDEKILGLVR